MLHFGFRTYIVYRSLFRALVPSFTVPGLFRVLLVSPSLFFRRVLPYHPFHIRCSWMSSGAAVLRVLRSQRLFRVGKKRDGYRAAVCGGDRHWEVDRKVER